MVGARSGTALNFHCGWPEGARTCAVPSPAMVKCLSLVPLRRLLGRHRLGHAAAGNDIERAAAGAHDQRASPPAPAAARAAGAAGFLVGGRQDDRRLAGVERRRHPGVDPDIGRRQHAVPVERRRGAHRALVARRDIGRHHQHHDQRAQRPGIVDRQPRRRQAGADALDRGQRALALRLPQRPRDRILRGQRIGQRGRRAMADAGAAVEPAQRLLAARPAKPDQRKQRGQRQQHEQAEPDGARRQTAAPATIRPRTPPETARRRSEAAPDAASLAPRRWRISPAAGPASAAAARRHQGRAPALAGRGWRRSIKLSGFAEQHPSTAAAMRHPFRGGNPHPEIAHNTKA